MRLKAKLSDQELLSRLPVWEALADFWLDTELADFQLEHIAQVLAASPYSIAEIKAIHLYEVAPAVSGNLAGATGEWAGFESDWLKDRCRAFASRRQSRCFRARRLLSRSFIDFFTARYWRQVLPRVAAIRDARRGDA